MPRVVSLFLPGWPIDRLRRVTDADLDRLGVLLEMHADRDGVLQHVPVGANLAPSKGSRVGGGSIQLGLTRSEIDGVGERLRQVLERVDAGKLAVF